LSKEKTGTVQALWNGPPFDVSRLVCRVCIADALRKVSKKCRLYCRKIGKEALYFNPNNSKCALGGHLTI